jgi:hypothetical protein
MDEIIHINRNEKEDYVARYRPNVSSALRYENVVPLFYFNILNSTSQYT